MQQNNVSINEEVNYSEETGSETREENKEGFPPPPGVVIENFDFELSAQLQILNKLAEKA